MSIICSGSVVTRAQNRAQNHAAQLLGLVSASLGPATQAILPRYTTTLHQDCPHSSIKSLGGINRNMALNWTMLSNNRTPVPLQNEMTITSVDNGVDLSLSIPDAPPTSSSQSGGSGGARKLRAVGKIWLTDQRLLFTSSSSPPASNPGAPSMDTLTIPLPSILSTKFEQPTFGSNYLTFDIKPSPEGGLTEGTNAILRFKERAMFEFVSLLEKTRERAIYMKRQQMMEDEAEEGLPSYSFPSQSSSTNVPVENPPGYEV